MAKSNTDQKTIIGRVENISLPGLGISHVPAKIDTGADLSSIWAIGIHEQDGVLRFKLFGKKSPYHTGEEIKVHAPDYLLTRIANSFGHREFRYVVKLQLKLGGRTVNGSFSLANRSQKTYPMLIGRKLLNRKFLVDVSHGKPLRDIEDKKKARLKEELKVFNLWEKKHENSNSI